jgi:putative flippase GtrA
MSFRSFIRRHPILLQICSFAAVGGTAAVADYSLMILLREIFRLNPVPAAMSGYALGSLISYVLNRIFTFDSDRSHVDAGWRFITVNVIGFLATGFLMNIFANMLAIPYLIARIQTNLILFVFDFTCHRLWTFRNAPVPGTGE